jgi:hypothetical protein
MRRGRAGVVLLLLAALPLQARAQGTPATEAGDRLRAVSFVGTWSGTLRCAVDPGVWPDDECDRRFTLEIHANTLRVMQTVRSKRGQETSGEVGVGKWGFFRLETNALALAMDTGEDAQGRWVESWTFVLSLKDPDHLAATWTRVVNHVDQARDSKLALVTVVATGDLAREGR